MGSGPPPAVIWKGEDCRSVATTIAAPDGGKAVASDDRSDGRVMVSEVVLLGVDACDQGGLAEATHTHAKVQSPRLLKPCRLNSARARARLPIA